MESYLKNVSFEKPLDQIWEEVDTDMNGYLDKEEARNFMERVVNSIQKDRAKNYDKSSFS